MVDRPKPALEDKKKLKGTGAKGADGKEKSRGCGRLLLCLPHLLKTLGGYLPP